MGVGSSDDSPCSGHDGAVLCHDVVERGCDGTEPRCGVIERRCTGTELRRNVVQRRCDGAELRRGGAAPRSNPAAPWTNPAILHENVTAPGCAAGTARHRAAGKIAPIFKKPSEWLSEVPS